MTDFARRGTVAALLAVSIDLPFRRRRRPPGAASGPRRVGGPTDARRAAGPDCPRP